MLKEVIQSSNPIFPGKFIKYFLINIGITIAIVIVCVVISMMLNNPVIGGVLGLMAIVFPLWYILTSVSGEYLDLAEQQFTCTRKF